MSLRGSVEYRGVEVAGSTMRLVQAMGLRRGKPSLAEVRTAVLKQRNFPGFFTQVAALCGVFPEEVRTLTRVILGIRDQDFRNKNLVQKVFAGAIRGPGNPRGRITLPEVLRQEKAMGEALAEYLGYAREGKIAFPLTPFEDSTDIPSYEATDQTDVVTYGRKLYKEFRGNMMLLGVGGSANGSRVETVAFLRDAKHAGFTYDSDYLRKVFEGFAIEKGHLIVVSLSGTTMETLSNLLFALEKLKEAGVPREKYKDHLTVLTGGEDSTLRKIAHQYGLNIFLCKKNEGGRFSIWTAIGTLWAEALGIDSQEAKAGALLAQIQAEEPSLRRNPAMMHAAIVNAAFRKQGAKLMQTLVFSEELGTFAEFFDQAWGESVEEEGIDLRSKVSIAPMWLHIGFNGIAAVPKGVFANLIQVRHSRHPVRLKVPPELRGITLGREGAIGDLHGVCLDDLMAQAVKGTWASFVGRRIPTVLESWDRITPFHLGQSTQGVFNFVAFFGGINGLGMATYDQPWVVLYKALGRGEFGKLHSMPDGAGCIRAAKYYDRVLST